MLAEISSRLEVSPLRNKDYLLLKIIRNYDYKLQTMNVNGYKVAMELAIKQIAACGVILDYR